MKCAILWCRSLMSELTSGLRRTRERVWAAIRFASSGETSLFSPAFEEPLLLDQLLCLLDDVRDADAELFESDGAGGGGAEAIDTDDDSVVADVLVPAHGGAGFDGDLGRALGEQAGLVGFVLLVEDLEAGHGDYGSVDAGGLELFGGLDDDRDLGAGGDEDDVLAACYRARRRPS